MRFLSKHVGRVVEARLMEIAVHQEVDLVRGKRHDSSISSSCERMDVRWKNAETALDKLPAPRLLLEPGGSRGRIQPPTAPIKAGLSRVTRQIEKERKREGRTLSRERITLRSTRTRWSVLSGIPNFEGSKSARKRKMRVSPVVWDVTSLAVLNVKIAR